MNRSPIAPLRRSRSPLDRPFRRRKPWQCRQPLSARAQRPAPDKATTSRTLLLLLCFLSLAAGVGSSSSIAWKDMAALVSLDNVGLFSINGRTGTSTTRFGPFYSPTLTDVDAFGMEEFTSSTSNLWFVDSRTAEISTAANQKASDLRFGFSCVKDNVLPRFYCTGGFAESLKTTDIPFYTIDMKDRKMKISRIGFSQRPPGKSVEYIGRGLHASAVIGNKLFLFGGLPCLFCKKPMWDVSTTAVIDITDPLQPTHKWLKGTSKGTPALQQFAGSCAVALPNGRALIIGGLTINATGQAAPLANVLWQFDPASSSYTAIPTKSGTAPSPGWGMSCALSTDAKSVFVHGGCDPSCVASDEDAVGGNGGPKDAAVYKLDVASVTRGGAGAVWTKIPDAKGAGPGPRCFASAAAYRDLFVVVGGQQKLSGGDTSELLGVAGKKSKKSAAAATARSVGLSKAKSPAADKKSKKVSSGDDEDKKRPSKGKEPKKAEPKAKATAAKAGTSRSVGSNLGALNNVKEKSGGNVDDDKPKLEGAEMTKPSAKAVSNAEEKQRSIGPPKDPKSPSVDALKKESAPPKEKTKPSSAAVSKKASSKKKKKKGSTVTVKKKPKPKAKAKSKAKAKAGARNAETDEPDSRSKNSKSKAKSVTSSPLPKKKSATSPKAQNPHMVVRLRSSAPAIDWSGIGPEAFMDVMKTMHSSINEAMQREESPALSSLHKRSDQELADDSLVGEYTSTKDDLPGLESGDQTGLFLFNTATSSWETNVKTLNIGAAPQVVQIPPRPSSTSTQPRSPTTTSKVTTVSPTKSPSPTVTETHRVSKLTPGAITAIVLGGLLAAVLAAVAACFVIYRRKNRNADGTQQSVAAVAKELKKELMERIKKTGERRPILGAAVKSKKPKWKKPQKRSDAPSETSSTRSSDSPVPVIKEPDLEIRGLSFLPPGYKLPPPPNMRPPAAAPAADESSPLLEPPSIARSNSRSSLLSHAEVAAADDDHPVVPSNIPRIATGPAKRLGLYRYVDLAKNAIIPVLAPIQEVYENPWSSGETTTTTTTDTTTSSAPPAPASSSPTPHRQKVGDITALSTEFENALYDVIGDLGRIPLTHAGAGQLGLELASMPLRTISLDAADPAVGYEVSSALQTEIRFQCVYYHNAKKSDEMNLQYGDVVMLRKFYSDGWARGVNVTQDTDGMFPIFYVEEATEAGYVESSGFAEVTPELEGYNAFESMIDK